MIGSQMDYEQIVAQAVSGQITMNAFLDKLQADSGLQQYVRAYRLHRIIRLGSVVMKPTKHLILT